MCKPNLISTILKSIVEAKSVIIFNPLPMPIIILEEGVISHIHSKVTLIHIVTWDVILNVLNIFTASFPALFVTQWINQTYLFIRKSSFKSFHRKDNRLHTQLEQGKRFG